MGQHPMNFEADAQQRTRRRQRRGSGKGRVPVSDVPRPGAFYQIQYGRGGFLTTAGRAYGVGPGPERTRFAQRIANHPQNRHLLVPAKNVFERKYFPRGVVSFLKRYSCGIPQGRARSGQRRCFGVVWIPPRAGGEPFRRPGTFALVQTTPKSVEDTANDLLAKLGAGRFCARRFVDLVIGEDDRSRVPDDSRTRIPFRWVCKLLTIHSADDRGRRRVGQATGVLLTPARLLTCAHVVATPDGTAEAVVVIPGFSKAEPAEVSAFDSDSAPFGAWLAPRFKPGGEANFLIAPEFRSHGDYAADYALIDLRGARRLTSWGKPADGWLSVSAPLATTAAQAALPGGEMQPLKAGDSVPTRKLVRQVGARNLKAAGFPADRICEMMLAEDRVRPDSTYPDAALHALIGTKLDTTFGNSGGPVWVERVVRRREGPKMVKRRQAVLAGLNQSGLHPVQERIDLSKSTRQRVVKKAMPKSLDLANHTNSYLVLLTPFALSRILNPGRLLPA